MFLELVRTLTAKDVSSLTEPLSDASTLSGT